jgi:hypothetical protein
MTFQHYNDPQFNRTVMRTHVLCSAMPEIPATVAGVELLVMIEPSGHVWLWDGWQTN